MEETYTVTRDGIVAVRSRLDSLLERGDESAYHEYEGAYGALRDLGLVPALDAIATREIIDQYGVDDPDEALRVMRERLRERARDIESRMG